MTIKDKGVDSVLETWTWGDKIVGAEESTELWRHPFGHSSNFSDIIVGARSWEDIIVVVVVGNS